MPAGVGATPARVMSSASSSRRDAHAGARPPRRRRATRRPSAAPGPAAGRAWPASGSSRVGDVAQVGDADPGRAAAAAAGRPRTAEPGVGHRAAPAPSSARSASGRSGSGEHAGQLGGAEPHGQHVVVPAGRQAHAGGRGRPDGVAGGGHVQLGEHVLEVDRGDRVHQAGRSARPGPPSASCVAVRAGQPVRHEDLGAGLAGGQGAHGRRPGRGRRPARPRPGAAERRCPGAVSRGGYRQRRTPIDPCSAFSAFLRADVADSPCVTRRPSGAFCRSSSRQPGGTLMRRTAAVASPLALATTRGHRGRPPSGDGGRAAGPRRRRDRATSCSSATTGTARRPSSTPGPTEPIRTLDTIPDRDERMAEILTAPDKLAFYLAVQQPRSARATTSTSTTCSPPTTAGCSPSAGRASPTSSASTWPPARSSGASRWRATAPTTWASPPTAPGCWSATRRPTRCTSSTSAPARRLREFASGDTPHENNYTRDGERIFHASIGRSTRPPTGRSPALDTRKGERFFQIVATTTCQIESPLGHGQGARGGRLPGHELRRAADGGRARRAVRLPAGLVLPRLRRVRHAGARRRPARPTTASPRSAPSRRVVDAARPDQRHAARAVRARLRAPRPGDERRGDDAVRRRDDGRLRGDRRPGDRGLHDSSTSARSPTGRPTASVGDECWVSVSGEDEVVVIDYATAEPIATVAGRRPPAARAGRRPRRRRLSEDPVPDHRSRSTAGPCRGPFSRRARPGGS